ncbi:hypothetical protein GCM10009737_07930 [Nocardioides lentus]|uniref:Uncharacterized protein n=1 Tax=Nocardioides lentus TaxID=338077 RepID=A0ABN2P200_9ACTN
MDTNLLVTVVLIFAVLALLLGFIAYGLMEALLRERDAHQRSLRALDAVEDELAARPPAPLFVARRDVGQVGA